MREYDFGWLSEPLSIRSSDFRIAPLGHAATRSLSGSLRHRDGWYLPPLQPEWMSSTEVHERTIEYAAWFALPATHRLTLTNHDDEDLAACIVGTLGVLKGLQLVLDGWGHFYKTPIKPGMLTDIVPTKPACARILSAAHDFWLRDPALGRLFFGAAHWHLFGCSYEHEFEKFGTAYTVLDTCWRIHAAKHQIKDSSVPHAERIVVLSTEYELLLPTWAVVTNRKSRLSELRNQYFHESRWGGVPIGFGHPGDVPDIALELFYFNTRLLLAVLGERSEYTRSSIDYQPHRLV